mgnify:CR=1 FL=1
MPLPSEDLLRQLLRELHLAPLDIELYLTSLRLGPVSIATLAAELKVARPNIYKVIASLETHGLARFSEQKGLRKTFSVEPPTKLTELTEARQRAIAQQQEGLARAMPDLLALYQQGELPTSIKVFEGAAQFERLFFQALDEAGHSFQFFGSAADFIQHISKEKHGRWMESRKRRGIRVQALFLPDPSAKTIESDHDPLRETRYLKNARPFSPSFFLFANKLILWQPKAPLALLIQDQYIVAMMQSMFQLLWEQSSPRPQ